MKKVFIDGQVGTTGLENFQRLSQRDDIEIIEIEHEKRKDSNRKAEIINSVDLSILCLPDGAAKETAKLLTNPNSKIVDASTAHRVNPAWRYGFPELHSTYREEIANAQLVANPGCHATGFIASVYPLIKSGVMPKNYPIAATSITGYSGGGKKLIEKYEEVKKSDNKNLMDKFSTRPYALGLTHKHLPEVKHICELDFKPQFYPIVGNFERGMLVSIPLFTSLLNKKVTPQDVQEILANHYSNQKFVRVLPYDLEATVEEGFLSATECNNTNFLDLMVFGHEEQISVIARLDNLGKGASGAAVQNMNIMLGIEEDKGL
jgi:N-acetyl-gamma-glutamyl-phosphate reductase